MVRSAAVRSSHALRVVGFCCRRWTLDIDHLQCPKLWRNRDEPSQQISADPSRFTIGLPIVLRGNSRSLRLKFSHVRRCRVG